MKKHLLVTVALLLLFESAYPQIDNSALAKQIVSKTARVKPKDVVLINGGIHTFSLMEQIAVEVNRLGGMAEIIVASDPFLISHFKEKPEADIVFPKYLAVWYNQADVIINLPLSGDFQKIFGDISPERLAILRKHDEQMAKELSQGHFSFVQITYPTKESAQLSKIDFATMEKMHWEAMNADYNAIEQKGKTIIDMLKAAKNIKISTPAGTQLSLTLGNRKIFKDDGILSDDEKTSQDYFARYASLPGGFIDFAPTENSVNGTVVVPRNMCRFESFNNIKFSVKNGVVENIDAKEGMDCYKKEMAPYANEKMVVSIFEIGLNPGYKVMEDNADYRPRNAAGLVRLTIGGNNQFYGGDVRSKGQFDFPLTNATVEADGKVLIKDGKLL